MPLSLVDAAMIHIIIDALFDFADLASNYCTAHAALFLIQPRRKGKHFALATIIIIYFRRHFIDGHTLRAERCLLARVIQQLLSRMLILFILHISL